MKQKFIYISKDGIPMAPTVDCSLLEAYNVDANELSKFSFAMGKKVDECKNTSIPILEEDQQWASTQIIKNTPVSKTEKGFTIDTFYPIEPYEFEEKCGARNGHPPAIGCSACHGLCRDKIAKIIRSEPKSDPKEKELYSIKPLEWSKVIKSNKGIRYITADFTFGYYIVDDQFWKMYPFTGGPDDWGLSSDFEDGKQKCANHFNSKLKLCLNREL